MPLRNIIHRASAFILGPPEGAGPESFRYADNEILFCKNNVCVHPPAAARQDSDVLHHPGYLTVTTKVFVDQYNESRRPTMFLTWIPNSVLTKPSEEANSPLRHKGSSVESLASNGSSECSNRSSECSNRSSECSNRSSGCSNRSSGCLDSVSVGSKNTNPFLEGDRELTSLEERGIRVNVDISSPGIEIVQTPDEGHAPTRFDFSARSRSISSSDSPLNWVTTPEFLMQQHSFPFQDSISSSPILNSRQTHKCRRFSVDLSQMRSLRLFFSDNNFTCGQVVVASRESQYKILHFHHGGLDHLAQVLHQWHSLLHNIKCAKGIEENLPYRHFMVCRPEVSALELHPEEGHVPKLTDEVFRRLFSDGGHIDDDLSLRKCIFFSGMDRSIRREVWPFLLHVYPYQSSYEERVQIAEIRRNEYEEISRRRLDLNENRLNQFRRTIQSVVEKDVVHSRHERPTGPRSLCFKREFTEGVALRMWEACWANYLTDYFHLFLCLAIISVYADDVIAQDLRSDEMLLHFSSLAMYMDGQLIARKARGLLHQFRQMREIPCSLAGLCTKCGPGIWDSSHNPRIFCVGHENSGVCYNCTN
ncbi:unnamed protein product [Phaedon cochleariae]|uniref:TBC1 domain family member 16 n=1 Tax=Phaedon cochleariae TaxID=80249 RepID=A0A9P0DH55_PHACE|nr:unnamed protein product [Phaedon cochleariae]